MLIEPTAACCWTKASNRLRLWLIGLLILFPTPDFVNPTCCSNFFCGEIMWPDQPETEEIQRSPKLLQRCEYAEWGQDLSNPKLNSYINGYIFTFTFASGKEFYRVLRNRMGEDDIHADQMFSLKKNTFADLLFHSKPAAFTPWQNIKDHSWHLDIKFTCLQNGFPYLTFHYSASDACSKLKMSVSSVHIRAHHTAIISTATAIRATSKAKVIFAFPFRQSDFCFFSLIFSSMRHPSPRRLPRVTGIE